MEHLMNLDAAELFVPTMSVAEVFVRAAVIYFGLCMLLRVIPKRQVGRSSLTDLLFVILVGGFAADGISKNADSITDFLMVLVTVMVLAYASDHLAYHFPWFRRLILEPPTCLIRDGRVLKANLRRELISEDDLMRELRRQDVDDPTEVKSAQLEADGEISVVTNRDLTGAKKPASAPAEDCGGAGAEANPQTDRLEGR